jgi:hypothetical protein
MTLNDEVTRRLQVLDEKERGRGFCRSSANFGQNFTPCRRTPCGARPHPLVQWCRLFRTPFGRCKVMITVRQHHAKRKSGPDCSQWSRRQLSRTDRKPSWRSKRWSCWVNCVREDIALGIILRSIIIWLRMISWPSLTTNRWTRGSLNWQTDFWRTSTCQWVCHDACSTSFVPIEPFLVHPYRRYNHSENTLRMS